MILLSCDPGSANVGVSIFDDSDLLYCARINYTSNREKFNDRLNDLLERIYLEFVRIVEKYKVSHICWEIVPAIGGMNHKDFVVSVSAALKAVAFQYEMIWQGIPAISAKKSVTGNYRASKEEVRDKVLSLFPEFTSRFPNVGPKQWDSYDSVIIGMACKNNDSSWHHPIGSAFTGKGW